MSIVLGITGFAGVGKSTAVRFLTEVYAARQVYLGAFILDEVGWRGLPPTRESERAVRLDLRSADRAAVMRLGAASIASALREGVPVVVDAVLLIEELDLLRSMVEPGRLHIAMIDSPVDLRCARLAHRASRPFSREEVLARDRTEIDELRTDRVFSAAGHRLLNDGALDDFRSALARLGASLAMPLRYDVPHAAT